MKPFNNQFATQKLRENKDPKEFNVNKVWDFLETRPFYNKEYMPKFNTAEEIYKEFGPKELELYSQFQWDGNDLEIHPREKAALQRRANYDALRGSKEIGETLNEVKFTIDDGDLYSAVMNSALVQDIDIKGKDEDSYLETDEETFQGIQAIAVDLDKVDALQYYNEPSDYMKHRQDPEYYEKEFQKAGTSDYFQRRGMDETSATTSGPGSATITPAGGSTDFYTTKKKKVKKEAKDVETKLAAGPADVYMKKKWGWKDASSIPNRPSKAISYIKVYEGEELNENYSRFKKETKTRTNEQQFHTAMRLAEKKIHEANRILEYTAQLKSELSVIKENKNTQRLMEKITRGIAEAYGKMKKLK